MLSTWRPMPLVRAPEAFDHPDWLFELKHDGFRALAIAACGNRIAYRVSARFRPELDPPERARLTAAPVPSLWQWLR